MLKIIFSIMAIGFSTTVLAQTPKSSSPESIQLLVLTNMADTLDVCGVGTVARRKLDYAINYYGRTQKQYTEEQFAQVRAKSKVFLTANKALSCQAYTGMGPQDIAEVIDTMVGTGPQNNGENFTR